MVTNKSQQRKRRAMRTRAKIKSLRVPRLSVHRSNTHIYAQLIAPDGAVLASASTLDKQLRADVKHGGNIDAAKKIGKAIAERASTVGVKKVAFDRSGYKFHGRVKALADAARESGLEF